MGTTEKAMIERQFWKLKSKWGKEDLAELRKLTFKSVLKKNWKPTQATSWGPQEDQKNTSPTQAILELQGWERNSEEARRG